MKNAIEEIFKIDTRAFEQEERNQLILTNEKKQCEEERKVYREEQLKNAYARALASHDRLVSEAKEKAAVLESTSEEEVVLLKARFQKIEKDVIEAIFNKLFSIECRG